MICCLLALLAALPGLAVLRRLRSGRATPGLCAVACAGGPQSGIGRDIGLAMAAAGTIVVITGSALSIHKWSHGMYWLETAPICSALDRVSAAPFRLAVSNR